MKNDTSFTWGAPMILSSLGHTLKSVISCTLIWISMLSPLSAQEPHFTKPTWWFGAAVGANFTTNDGATQNLNEDFAAPIAFSNGHGVGLYAAPVLQYHRPEAIWGFMLQAGYDNRNSSFQQETAPCNCPADLSTALSYITIEPSLRVAPFTSGFHLFGGPRLAFNMNKSFSYQERTNPDFPEQLPSPEEKGDFSNIKSTLLSMQIGAGYDIPIFSQDQKTQFVVSPFISFHPFVGQTPRTIENWSITTVRVGAAIKFGHGRLIPEPPAVIVIPLSPDVRFSVTSPKNAPVEPRLREVFPIRNYVFFDIGSTQIPDRYVTLRKIQVKDFKEDNLELFKPKNISGRSERQMIVYYNVLNILAVRLLNDPSATITLVGSSELGPEDGRAMAAAIKTYLVDVFGLVDSRVSIEGRDKPKIPSEQPGGTLELDLLRAGDRRVSIESNSPALLMEFQNGPTASLRPIEIMNAQEAPFSSYVSFNVEGAKEAFSSWSLEVRDENGKVQYFGPYTQEKVSIAGKSILGTRPEGDFKTTIIGQTKTGQVVRKDATAHIVLWAPSKTYEGMRYSVLYEFNESKAIPMYEKYITDLVILKIPIGGKVVIHGYTDIIGDEANNLKLSLARANDVKSIIENSLSKAGRSDVALEVIGSGEDENLSLFKNTYPEERFYNRTVVIDIFPR